MPFDFLSCNIYGFDFLKTDNSNVWFCFDGNSCVKEPSGKLIIIYQNTRKYFKLKLINFNQ